MTDNAELQRSVERLSGELAAARAEFAKTEERRAAEFVRRDVYMAEQALLLSRVVEVEKDNLALEAKIDKAEERRAADRRLILTSLVLPIVVALILLYVQSQVGGPP